MTRRVPLHVGPALSLFVAVCGASSAEAQTTATQITQAVTSCQTATLYQIDGESVINMATPRPISRKECEDNVSVTLQLPNSSALQDQLMFTFVDINGNDQNCSDATNRYDADTTTIEACAAIDDVLLSGNNALRNIDVPIRAACPGGYYEKGTAEGDWPDIARVSTKSRSLWILQLDNPEQTTTGACYSISLDFDTAAPQAPSGLQDAQAETSFPLSWDRVTDSTLQYYAVILDTNATENTGDGDAICSSAALTQLASDSTYGTDLSDLPAGVQVVVDDIPISAKPEYALKFPRFSGEYGAAAVVALDKAGNASPPSNIACLRRVQTCGIGNLEDCPIIVSGPDDTDDSGTIGIGDDPVDLPVAGSGEDEDSCVGCVGFDGGGSACSVSTLNGRRHAASALPYLLVLAGLLLRSRRRIS